MSKSNFGIMVDNETLGVDPKSIVLQTAMVAFDLDDGLRLSDGFDLDLKYNLPVDAQQRMMRTIDMTTLSWWLKQSDEARNRVNTFEYGDTERLRKLLVAMNEFVAFRRQYCIESGGRFEIWSRGSMDMNQLDSLFRWFNIRPEWKYNEVMDLRTAMNIHGVDNVEPRKDHIAHDCLSDCYYQIKCYRAILQTRGDIE